VCLEGFQSGLSWLTILRKRAHFRRVFRDVDIERVARFNACFAYPPIGGGGRRLLGGNGYLRSCGSRTRKLGPASAMVLQG
jgi:hypothetical protein